MPAIVSSRDHQLCGLGLHRFCLSLRDVVDLLAERGIIVSCETIRQWCEKFGPGYARKLKRREVRLGDHWNLDEVFIRINGQQKYLWRTVDQDGNVIDILVHRIVINVRRSDFFEGCCAVRGPTFPHQSRQEHGVGRLLYRAYNPVPDPVRLSGAGTRAAADPPLWRYCTSNWRVDGAATSGSISVGECAQGQPAELERAQRILQDWPNLARYRADNATVKPPASGENRVVFMGDSITDAWGRRYDEAFFSGKPYINRGISGQTTPQMLVRFRPDVLAHKPAVVVILAGTNDIAGNTGPMSLEDIQGNLQSMAELAKANGIRVVLASVLPTSDYHRNQTTRRPNEKIRQLNDWIKTYAAENGHVYLDYYSAMLDDQGVLKKELTYDGLHPNEAGYQLMAPLAEKAIAQALQ